MNRLQIKLIGKSKEQREYIATKEIGNWVNSIVSKNKHPDTPWLEQYEDKLFPGIKTERNNAEFWEYVKQSVLQSVLWNLDENFVKTSLKAQLLFFAHEDPKKTLTEHFFTLMQRENVDRSLFEDIAKWCIEQEKQIPRQLLLQRQAVRAEFFASHSLHKTLKTDKAMIGVSAGSRYIPAEVSYLTATTTFMFWLAGHVSTEITIPILGLAFISEAYYSYKTYDNEKLVQFLNEIDPKISQLKEDFFNTFQFKLVKILDPNNIQATSDIIFTRFAPQSKSSETVQTEPSTTTNATPKQKVKRHGSPTPQPTEQPKQETKSIQWTEELTYNPTNSECKIKPQQRNHGTFFSYLDTGALKAQGLESTLIEQFQAVVNNGRIKSQGSGIKPCTNTFFRSHTTKEIAELTAKLKLKNYGGRVCGRRITDNEGNVLEIFDTLVKKTPKLHR